MCTSASLSISTVVCGVCRYHFDASDRWQEFGSHAEREIMELANLEPFYKESQLAATVLGMLMHTHITYRHALHIYALGRLFSPCFPLLAHLTAVKLQTNSQWRFSYNTN